jgi:hypothetical protein
MNSRIYDLPMSDIVNVLASVGALNTVLVKGNMGTGKSSLLKELGKRFPHHKLVYFDCTTKDVGDIGLPSFQTIDGNGVSRFVPNEELGIHLGKDVIVMIDELGKAPPGVKLAMNRFMLEREIFSYKLTDASIVFATTNKSGEGLGDILPAHTRNRLAVVTMRNHTVEEWLAWGLMNNIHPAVLRFVSDTPAVFHTFEDIPNPRDAQGNLTNPYVFHPGAPMEAFCTPRSLHAASDFCWARDSIGDAALTALLIGTIGDRAALDLMTYIKLISDMPTTDDIKRDPVNARVPSSPAAAYMVVYRTLGSLAPDWGAQWMTYILRMDAELQQYFFRSAMAQVKDKGPCAFSVMLPQFREWALKNNFAFQSDKV